MKRWIKRISCIVLCIMTIFTIYSYTVKVTAAEGTEIISFTGSNNSYSSTNFTVSLSERRTNGSLLRNDIVTITAKNSVYISSIKVNGTLTNFKATCDLDTASNRDGIVDYDNSLIEYINGASIAYLTAESDTTLTSLEITYTTVKNRILYL